MKEPAWEQSRTAWVEPGTHLQVPVPCKQGKLLRIEFDVLYGIDVDFLVMFEGVDGTVISLYGPTRRARGVTTVLEVPSEGEAYVTFDNINSWVISHPPTLACCCTRPQWCPVGPDRSLTLTSGASSNIN